MRLRLCIWMIVLSAGSAWPQLELVVGREGYSYLAIQDSVAFVNRAPDSLWTWVVTPGENLMANALARGGKILVSVTEPTMGLLEETIERPVFRRDITAVQAIADGDPGTAFDPDEFGLSRQASIYIDLGGAYTIVRTRAFPRLDAEHIGRFPQTFDLGLGDRLQPVDALERLLTASDYLGGGNLGGEVRFQRYVFFGTTRPNIRAVIEWPGVLPVSGQRQARYVRFQPLGDAPWELAELELYTDGTTRPGFFRSVPLLATTGTPVWGRLRHEGGAPLEELPIVVQTRTGPDDEPVHYFITQGPQEIRVSRGVWENAPEFPGIAQGPVASNPDWSGWETVTGGVVRSPSPNRFLQFQVRFLQPGVKLERLVFEYSSPPVAGEIYAEISPPLVDVGVETAFVAVVQTHRLAERSDTGFRFVEVLTAAQIEGIDSVKVDDEHALHTLRLDSGRGFAVNLWQRVLKDGSLVHIFFRGKVFVDGTRFDVRVGEQRHVLDEAPYEMFQHARGADVDPVLLGEGLTVRLSASNAALVADVEPTRRVLTPNGDGVNDLFAVAYSLLKLTRPAAVFFRIYDLGGGLVRRGYAGEDQSGRFAQVWDGRDDWGRLVAPGIYLYHLEVAADVGTTRHSGLVNVAY
ncbi:MAG: gliding motility-associated C-terminal domain-containing protein [Gemmatimonadota bacterium]|nr:gliding motility-associated C-terminal domain-containing protein [Gemmatimonadota bacterium]